MILGTRTIAAVWILGVLAAALAAGATEKTSLGTKQDEQAIFALIASYQEAWNKKDAAGLANLFAEDADFSSIYGQTLQGRATIGEKHSNLFKGPQRESIQSRNPADVKIRFVKPDVASVDSISEITGVFIDPEGTRKNSMNRLLTNMVLVKNGDRWEIAVFHNMMLPNIPMPPSTPE
jgi:uncharacterized protein (TIGR02246 family)